MANTSYRRIAGLALGAVVLAIFWDSPVVWPLKILVVLFHELGHAAAALLTGGTVESIGLSPDQGGVTHTRGGWRFLILNAGYLGSLIWGVALLAAGRTPKAAKWMCGGLALVLLGSTLWWVRPVFSFGFAFSLVAGIAMALLTQRGTASAQTGLLRGMGVFSVLYAVWDIRDDIFRIDGGMSDAVMLQELTMVPGPIWGLAWLVVGLATLWSLRRWWL